MLTAIDSAWDYAWKHTDETEHMENKDTSQQQQSGAWDTAVGAAEGHTWHEIA